MAVTVISRVDPTGAGDYLTLAAWWAARKGNLVVRDTIEVAEIYGGGSVGPLRIVAADGTVDAEHYAVLRPATGHAHAGVFDVTKAYLKNDAVNSAVIYSELGFLRIEPGLCLDNAFFGNAASNVQGIDLNISAANAPCRIEGLIGRCSAAKNVSRMIYIRGSATDSQRKHTISRCVLYDHFGHFSQCIVVETGWVNVVGNTLIADNNTDHPCCILTQVGAGHVVSQDNYLRGGWQCYFAATGIIDKGSNDATHNAEALTPALRNIAYSDANFVNTAVGSENLHLTETSALKGQGVPMFSAEERGINRFPVGIGWNRFLLYDNKLWSIGGQTGAVPESRLRKVYWSDDEGWTWHEAGVDALPIAISDPAVCVYDGKMWAAGGGWTNLLYSKKVFWSTNGSEWHEAGIDALPIGVLSSDMLVYDNKMWLIGGEIALNLCTRKVWWSTDGVTWTEAGVDALPHRLAAHSTLVHNGYMYVVGGDDSTGVWQSRSVLRSLNGAVWEEVGVNALPRASFFMGLVEYEDKLWIIGGWPQDAGYSYVYYSLDHGATWIRAMYRDLPYIYYARSTVVLGGRILTMQGSSEAAYNRHIYGSIDLMHADIDRQPRSISAPCIGADDLPVEFTGSIIDGVVLGDQDRWLPMGVVLMRSSERAPRAGATGVGASVTVRGRAPRIEGSST